MTPEYITLADVNRHSDNARAAETRRQANKEAWMELHKQEAEDIRRTHVVLLAAFGGMFVAGGMLCLSEFSLAGTAVCWAVAGWLFWMARRRIREQ